MTVDHLDHSITVRKDVVVVGDHDASNATLVALLALIPTDSSSSKRPRA